MMPIDLDKMRRWFCHIIMSLFGCFLIFITAEIWISSYVDNRSQNLRAVDPIKNFKTHRIEFDKLIKAGDDCGEDIYDVDYGNYSCPTSIKRTQFVYDIMIKLNIERIRFYKYSSNKADMDVDIDPFSANSCVPSFQLFYHSRSSSADPDEKPLSDDGKWFYREVGSGPCPLR